MISSGGIDITVKDRILLIIIGSLSIVDKVTGTKKNFIMFVCFTRCFKIIQTKASFIILRIVYTSTIHYGVVTLCRYCLVFNKVIIIFIKNTVRMLPTY